MGERSLFGRAARAVAVAAAMGSAAYVTQPTRDLSSSAQGRISVSESQACLPENWDACFSIGPVPGIISIGVTGDAVITDTSVTIPPDMAARHLGDTTLNFVYVEDDKDSKTHITAQCYEKTELSGKKLATVSEGEFAQLFPYEPRDLSKDGGARSCTVFDAARFATHTPRPTPSVEATPAPAGMAFLPNLKNNQ